MRDNASCCAHSPRSWCRRIVLACLCVFPILLFLLAPTEDLYTYTISDGEATITQFDTSYSGELSITNELGGVPVTAIARQAFAHCFFLTDVTIPDGVTDIGQHAFFGCTNITAITIPASVTNINDHAFYLCISLTNITVSGSNPKYADIGGVLFNKDRTTLLTYPSGLSGSYTVPDGTSSIGANAFAGCLFLGALTLPDSVTDIGNMAFSLCTSLTAVAISDNVTNIGERAFLFCASLVNVTIPNGVTSIGDSVFSYCRSLADVTIPNNVTDISDSAFAGCSSLTAITIPSSVTDIGGSAFRWCVSLTDIYFCGDAPSVGTNLFSRTPATVYRMQGKAGWPDVPAPWQNRPTALWNPPSLER